MVARVKNAVTLYDFLGVSEEASNDQIRRAYLRLAIYYNPDLCTADRHAKRMFKRLLYAYWTLKDVRRREKYDHFLAAHRESSSSNQGMPESQPSPTRFPGRTPATYRFVLKPTVPAAPDFYSTRSNDRNASFESKRFEYGVPFPQRSTPAPNPASTPYRDRFTPRATGSAPQANPSVSLDDAPQKPSRPRSRSVKQLIVSVAGQTLAIMAGGIAALIVAHFVLQWLQADSGGVWPLLAPWIGGDSAS